ncbi:hypothetical protein Ciccas_007689 [Cichlidogyrus casuarinus]|uniref:Uncharacterized protein n=1 Tax=Cichlidogyrus casuarinus TaxID=1844966 RepID=A0ABD2Q268_9PLAT
MEQKLQNRLDLMTREYNDESFSDDTYQTSVDTMFLHSGSEPREERKNFRPRPGVAPGGVSKK